MLGLIPSQPSYKPTYSADYKPINKPTEKPIDKPGAVQNNVDYSGVLPGQGFQPMAPPPIPSLPRHVPSYSLQFWPQFPLGRITPAQIEDTIRESSRDVHSDGQSYLIQ